MHYHMKEVKLKKDDQLFLAAVDTFMLQFDESLSSNDKYCRYVRNLMTTHPNYFWQERNPLCLDDANKLKASSNTTSYLTPGDQDIFDAVTFVASNLSPQFVPLPSKVINQLKLYEFRVGGRKTLSLGDLDLKLLCTDGYFHRLRMRRNRSLSGVHVHVPLDLIKLRMYILSSVVYDLSLRYNSVSYPPTSLIDNNYVGSVIHRYTDGRHVHTDAFEYFSDMYLK